MTIPLPKHPEYKKQLYMPFPSGNKCDSSGGMQKSIVTSLQYISRLFLNVPVMKYIFMDYIYL